jgi:hypothetical protein
VNSLRPRLTFANVISVIALFIALGGGAMAAVKLKANSVKSKHIASNAATGNDVAEDTLAKVPSAAQADLATNATNADNAATVNGVSSDDFQFGDGFDGAGAGILEDGEAGGLQLFEGDLGFVCDATPQLAYVDAAGDADVTDIWVDGTHTTLDDGDGLTPVNVTAAGDTVQVQIWGGAGIVADVLASLSFDATPTPDECSIAIVSQENVGPGAVLLSRAGQDRLGDRRSRGLPDGWVELGGR